MSHITLQVSGDEWATNLTAPNSSLLAALVAGVGIATPRVAQLGEKLYLGNLSLGTNYSVQTYRYTGWLDVAQPALQVTQCGSLLIRTPTHTLRDSTHSRPPNPTTPPSPPLSTLHSNR